MTLSSSHSIAKVGAHLPELNAFPAVPRLWMIASSPVRGCPILSIGISQSSSEGSVKTSGITMCRWLSGFKSKYNPVSSYCVFRSRHWEDRRCDVWSVDGSSTPTLVVRMTATECC